MGQARGCGKEMTSFYTRGFYTREITVLCGNTDTDGGQYLCHTCEALPDPNYCTTCGDFVGDAYGADYLCRCG